MSVQYMTTITFSTSEIPCSGVEFRKLVVGELEESILVQATSIAFNDYDENVFPLNRYEISSVITSLLILALGSEDPVRKEELLEMSKQWQDISDTMNNCMRDQDVIYMHIEYEEVQ